MSLKKEKSEPASDEARRLPRFSSSASRDSSECSSEARGGAGVRVRSGMLPGAARDDAGVFGGGMVPVERTRADRATLELFREIWRRGSIGQGREGSDGPGMCVECEPADGCPTVGGEDLVRGVTG